MSLVQHFCCHTLLKQHTSELHRTLDDTPLLKRLMSASLSQGDYQQTLSCLYSWYDYTESLLDKELLRYGAFDLPGFTSRVNKSGLLRDDLIAQGVTNIDDLSGFHFALPNDNLFTIMGICYVVEGSSLGGLVLGPRLRKVLPDIQATRFYDVYGEHKIHIFKNVMAQIQLLLNTQCDLSQPSQYHNVTPHIHYQTAQASLIKGADAAFSSLINWVNVCSQDTTVTHSHYG